MLLLPHCLHISAYCTSFFTCCSFHTRKPPPPLPPVQGLRGLDAFCSETTSFAPFHLSSRGSNSSRSVNLNTQTAVIKTIKLTGLITEPPRRELAAEESNASHPQTQRQHYSSFAIWQNHLPPLCSSFSPPPLGGV